MAKQETPTTNEAATVGIYSVAWLPRTIRDAMQAFSDTNESVADAKLPDLIGSLKTLFGVKHSRQTGPKLSLSRVEAEALKGPFEGLKTAVWAEALPIVSADPTKDKGFTGIRKVFSAIEKAITEATAEGK